MTPLSSEPVRRRVAAAGAVLGLVAASVIGGVALSASAAIPKAPSILSPAAGTHTASGSITLSGAIDPQGLSLTVHVVVESMTNSARTPTWFTPPLRGSAPQH